MESQKQAPAVGGYALEGGVSFHTAVAPLRKGYVFIMYSYQRTPAGSVQPVQPSSQDNSLL